MDQMVSDTFNFRLNSLKDIVNEKDNRVGQTKFSHYFNNKLIPLLKEQIIDPVNKRQTLCYMDKQQP